MATRIIAILLTLIGSARIVSTYKILNNTVDEPAHLAAGIEWVENGTYTYEDQHPPLARVAGALGAYFAGARWSRQKGQISEGFHLLGYQHRYTRVLFYSRLAMLPFFWIGSAAVFWWARRAAGDVAGVLATLLFTTTPTVLAHAGLVTTDTAMTGLTCMAAVYSLHWGDKPGWRRSLLLGLLLAGAFLSKFSSLAFLPAGWILMYSWHLWNARPGWRIASQEIIRALPQALLAWAVAAFLIWAMFNFDYGYARFFKRPVPAYEFFNGIASAWRHNEAGHPAYLLGQVRTRGFWYYYPVALSVKTPLAMLVLVMASVIILFRRNGGAAAGMAAMFALGVLAVGMTSHINIGVRHVLPVYSGFAVCGGMAAAYLAKAGRAGLISAILLLGWHAVSGALAHPDYLSYSNEIARGHLEKILADSDLDWFQDMRQLAIRLRQLGARHVYLKANDPDFMAASGLQLPPWDVVPDGDQPPTGWSALQVTWWKLSGQPKWADRAEPREKIGRSIFLYYFSEPRRRD